MINIIGTASKYLFGTLDESNKQEIINLIQVIEKNIRSSFINNQILLENFTKNYNLKINSIIKNQALLFHEIKNIILKKFLF